MEPVSPPERSRPWEPLFGALEYFREKALRQEKTVPDLDAYPAVVWLWELQALPEVSAPPSPGSPPQESWLRIRKPVLPELPPFPEASLPWVPLREEVGDSTPPKLKEKAWREGQWLELASFPAVQSQWERWIEGCWKPWAEKHRKARRAYDVYRRLVELAECWREDCGQYELLMGIGLLTWTLSAGTYLRRHLLVLDVEVRWDGSSTVTINPSPLGFSPRIEWDVLENFFPLRPDPEQKELCNRWAEALCDPWDREETERILRALLGVLPQKGDYLPSLEPAPQAGEFPRVWLAPAFFLRKHSEGRWARFAEGLREKQMQGAPFPVGEFLFGTAGAELLTGVERTEVYPLSPLPLNQEQQAVLHAAKTSIATLVDGPPGSGKTQTMASLVADLLSKGKKVLVVSSQASTLRKLKERLPEELLPLCLFWTGVGSEFLASLQSSVQALFRSTAEHSLQSAAEEVARLEQEQRETQTRLLELEERLVEKLSQDRPCLSLAAGAYEGRPEEVLRRLHAEREVYGWVADRVGREATLPRPPEDWKRLAGFFRSLSLGRISDVTSFCPDPILLPSPESFAAWVEEERRNRLHWEAFVRERGQDWILQLAGKDPAVLEGMLRSLSEVCTVLQSLRHASLPFLSDALEEVVFGDPEAWERLWKQTETFWNAGLPERLEKVKDWTLASARAADLATLLGDVTALLQYWEEKGAPPRFGIFRPRVLRETAYLRSAVRLNGRPCRTLEALQNLQEYCRTHLELRKLCRLWDRYASIPPEASPMETLELLRQHHHWLGQVLELGRRVREARVHVELALAPREVPWTDDTGLRQVIAEIQAALAYRNWQKSREPLQALLRQLHLWGRQRNGHPILQELIRASEQGDPLAYEVAYGELVNLWEERKTSEEAHELLDALSEVAPELARRIRENPRDAAWPSRLEALPSAWQWAKAWSELREQAEEDRETFRLHEDYQELWQRWHEGARSLLAASAWLQFLTQFGAEKPEALIAWKKALEDASMRPHPSCELYRREAWRHALDLLSIFPAWFLAVPAGLHILAGKDELFDTVMVASAELLPSHGALLALLGRRTVLFGDGNQPGLERREEQPPKPGVEEPSRWLSGFPYADRLTAANTFWDLAEVRFPVRRSLRRRFGSRPELSALLSGLSYPERALLPMRLLPPGRGKPVHWEHVPEGVQQGQGPEAVNPFEAHALLQRLRQLLQDPFYAGKTLAVVAASGPRQATLLRRLSYETLPSHEITRRQFLCGTPLELQGRMRDLVLVSLGIAPNEPPTPWPQAWGQKLLHTLLSLAEEELWIFHSILPEDLPEEDARRRLFPGEQMPSVDLPIQLAEPSRLTDPVHKEIARTIEELGYAVYAPCSGRDGPVFPADLVAFGSRGSLSVLGPFATERFGMDGRRLLQRQKEWEVCGYPFFLVTARAWIGDQEWLRCALREALVQWAGEPA